MGGIKQMARFGSILQTSAREGADFASSFSSNKKPPSFNREFGGQGGAGGEGMQREKGASVGFLIRG